MTSQNQNIILVTADSLRADHCGFLTPGVDLTPTLDALAEQGIVFENAMASAPRTTTSVPEMLTGQPMPSGAVDSHAAEVSRITTHLETYETVAERLSAAGYTTAALSANPWISTRTGAEKAFDVFDEVGAEESGFFDERVLPLLSDTKVGDLAYWLSQWRRKRGFLSQWPSFFDDLLATVAALPEPYFLWVFLLDTHNPYIVPREDRVENSTMGMYYGMFRGNSTISHSAGQSRLTQLSPRVETYVKRAYRDSVRSVDRFVGELVRATADDEPLLVFNSDHGEAFNEHGSYGHQQVLYEENVHVPLLVHDPRLVGEGQRVSDPVSLRSLSDMLVAFGRDGTPVTSDEWTAPYVVSRSERADRIAVRSRDHKLIWSEAEREFYDLVADPGERHNLIEEADVSEFERVAADYRESIPSGEEGSSREELSDSVQRQLSVLGYRE